jgi:hypothetical protein
MEKVDTMGMIVGPATMKIEIDQAGHPILVESPGTTSQVNHVVVDPCPVIGMDDVDPT